MKRLWEELVPDLSPTSVQMLWLFAGMFALCLIVGFPIWLYVETDWGLRRRELAFLRAQDKRAERAYEIAQLDMQEIRDGWQEKPVKRAYLLFLLDFQDVRYQVYDWLWLVRDKLQEDPYSES
jgi:hypothetical protein